MVMDGLADGVMVLLKYSVSISYMSSLPEAL